MNKLRTLRVLFLLLLIFCNAKTDNKAIRKDVSSGKDVALKFINDYVIFCNKRNLNTNSIEWIKNNELATPEFKNKYEELVENALKADPEIGLGFDPIFDAQDYPEKGFIFLTYDKGYVTVKAKDESELTTVIKIQQIGDKWMVDGAGIVNIPKDKQARR